ncbi:MAG: Holliday junction branch migration protein RuvA [Verrucomicrobiota bacterium]|nr:Holliday junction branch migration protein RuvA [Verrucomicrobiota bacterium]
MMVFLEGVLEEKEPTRAVINVNGIGYEASISVNSYDRLPAVGETFRLLTVPVVREDAHLLFGFMSGEERSAFLLLTTVNGIGPKLGLAVLSGLSVRELKSAVAKGDIKRLSGISGVGKKTAERIVLEMRDKLGHEAGMDATPSEGSFTDHRLRDAVLALTSLGYRVGDAEQMVRKISTQIGEKETVEELLRMILAKR